MVFWVDIFLRIFELGCFFIVLEYVIDDLIIISIGCFFFGFIIFYILFRFRLFFFVCCMLRFNSKEEFEVEFCVYTKVLY